MDSIFSIDDCYFNNKFRGKILKKLKQLASSAILGISLLFSGVGIASSTLALTEPQVVAYATDEEAEENMAQFADELFEATEGNYREEDDTIHPSSDYWTTEDGKAYRVLNGEAISRMKPAERNKFYSRIQQRQTTFLKEQEEIEDGKGVTSTTASLWWKEMQSVHGVGAQYVAQLTSGLKVDLVAGNMFFQPLNGIIGVVLGIASVAIMSFLALSFMLDIFYITIPFFRMMCDNSGGNRQGSRQGGGYGGGMGIGGGRGGAGGPAYISAQAKNAVREEEGGRNALLSYFKHSVVKIVVLVLCLMFLISGKIYSLIGTLMNIVAAMFGFSSI